MSADQKGLVSYEADVSTNDSQNGVRARDGGLAIIDQQWWQAIDGDLWFSEHYDSDIDVAAPQLWRISVPTPSSGNLFRVHTMFHVSAATLLEIFGDVTLLNFGGNEMDIFNEDHNVSPTPTTPAQRVRLYVSPIVGGGGLGQIIYGRELGAAVQERISFVAKSNSDYLVRMTPAANNMRASIRVAWHY